MTIEVNVQFTDLNADAAGFFEDLVECFDAAAILGKPISGGVRFYTEQEPKDFFGWLWENNFEMDDFKSIEVKPIRAI